MRRIQSAIQFRQARTPMENLEQRVLLSALTITAGGTYSGDWSNVTVDTTAAVIIQNSTISGTGTLINTAVSGTNITIQNTTATGLDPTTAGVAPGQFIDDGAGSSLTIENCSINNCGGYVIQVQGWSGGSVNIDYNSITNVNGMYSNGDGGYESTGEEFPHAIIFSQCTGLTNTQIAWNSIVNTPGQSYANDLINMYETSGTTSSPIQIDNNYINGLYAIDPSTQYDSGCGIITDGTTETTAYVNIFDNTVLNTGNCGINMPDGHNNNVYDNTVLSTGVLPDGDAFYGENVGISCYNAHSSSLYGNNNVYDNISGWIRMPGTDFNSGANTTTSDYFVPGVSEDTGNTSLALSNVSSSAQSAAYAAWEANATSAGVTVGPGSGTSTGGGTFSGGGSNSGSGSTGTGGTGSSTGNSGSDTKNPGGSGNTSSGGATGNGSGSTGNGSTGSGTSTNTGSGTGSSGSSSSGSGSSGTGSSGSGSSSSSGSNSGSGTSTGSGGSSYSGGSHDGGWAGDGSVGQGRWWRRHRHHHHEEATVTSAGSSTNSQSFGAATGSTDAITLGASKHLDGIADSARNCMKPPDDASALSNDAA